MTVLPDSEVTVKQASTSRGPSGIRILIHAGRVWARVVRVAGSRSNLALESNEYTATARDGLIGAEQGAEGFVCWTRHGELSLTNRSGHTEAVLMAGQRAWARPRLPVTPGPFVPSASVLEIRSTGPVLPLVRMPDGRMAAGFLAEDVEVNQVFGSLTEAGRGQRWLVEVPGGTEGAYTLVLTGAAAGSFTVRLHEVRGLPGVPAGDRGRRPSGGAAREPHHARREGRGPADGPRGRDARRSPAPLGRRRADGGRDVVVNFRPWASTTRGISARSS